MKIRLVVALAGLAISFALPTFAQKKASPIQNYASRLLARDVFYGRLGRINARELWEQALYETIGAYYKAEETSS
jgi:hypothetical protein